MRKLRVFPFISLILIILFSVPALASSKSTTLFQTIDTRYVKVGNCQVALLQDGRSSKLVYKENGNTYTIAYGATSAVFSGKTVYYTYGNTLVKWSASTKTAKGVSTLKGNKDPIYANDYIISLEGGCRNYLYYTSYVGPLVANENVYQYSLKTNKSKCIVKNAYGWGAYSKYLVVPKSSMDPAYVPLYVLNMSNGKLKLLDNEYNCVYYNSKACEV